jgi:hypothetical protein
MGKQTSGRIADKKAQFYEMSLILGDLTPVAVGPTRRDWSFNSVWCLRFPIVTRGSYSSFGNLMSESLIECVLALM